MYKLLMIIGLLLTCSQIVHAEYKTRKRDAYDSQAACQAAGRGARTNCDHVAGKWYLPCDNLLEFFKESEPGLCLPVSYWRGTLWLREKNCHEANKDVGGCEWSFWAWYPKCRELYYAQSASICSFDLKKYGTNGRLGKSIK